MSEPFITIDLHGMNVSDAEAAVEKALSSAGQGTYQIRLVHGFNRGTGIRDMIYREFRYDGRIVRIAPGDNQGITVLILRELY